MRVSELEAALEALSTRWLGARWRVKPETDSTMDDAWLGLEEGADHGFVVVADHQRAGRGSHGRRWASPAGRDLYLSAVVRTPRPQPTMTLATALAVVETVREALGDKALRDAALRDAALGDAALDDAALRDAARRDAALGDAALRDTTIRVKWPNDVLVGERKIAGILCESRSRGARFDAVIGVGLNVNREAFDPALGATSLRIASGRAHDRGAVLGRLLLAMERWLGAEPAAVTAALDEALAWRGEQVSCDEVTGELLGVAPGGGVRLATPTGERVLHAGRLRRR